MTPSQLGTARPRAFTAALGILWPLVIAALTLRSAPNAAELVALTPWWCVACGEAGAADLFQNVLLFLPLGLAWRGWGWRLGTTAGIALLATVAIEATQALALSGRDAALGDVMANTAGAVVGWWVAPLLLRLRHGDPTVARRAAAAALGVFALQLLAAAWLLDPASADQAAQQRIARSPDAEGPRYGGVVLAAGLTSPTPALPLGTLTMQATWAEPSPNAWTAVVGFGRSEHDVLAGVAFRGGAAVAAGYRTRAEAFRWRSPVVIAPLPPLGAGDTVTIALSVGDGAITLAASGRDTSAVPARVASGAQHGWVLINPFTQRVGIPGAWQRWTLAWLFGWGLLLGWGAGASGQAVRWALGLTAVAGAIPASTGTSLQVGEGVALAAGWLLAAAWGALRVGVTPRAE